MMWSERLRELPAWIKTIIEENDYSFKHVINDN